jgi:hypothetical protein
LSFAAHNPLRYLDPDGRDWTDPFRWVGRHAASAARFVAPRLPAALKLYTAGQGVVTGVTSCLETLGAGCALALFSADQAGSAMTELITGEPAPTVLGQIGGPTAQQIEEAIVDTAALVGAVKGPLTRATRPPLPADPPGTTAANAAEGERITDPSRLLPERAGPTGNIAPSEVAGKTPAQIDARARQLGLTPRGPDPASGRGAYIDPQTGQQRILSHPNASPPHGHVNNPAGQRIDINGNLVPPESPAAHLPLGGGG